MFDGITFGQIQLVIVIGAGMAAGIAALMIGQRTLGRWMRAAEVEEEDPLQKNPSLVGRQANKRESFRRSGNCVEVQISDIQLESEPWNGMVLDRSMNGLRLRSEKEAAVDTVLNVRVVAESPMPWVEVQVAHCNSSADGWEIGCRFTGSPAWNLLFMFG